MNVVKMFEQMTLIREVETRLLELFGAGLLRGTVHTCIGQEACAVGVVSALDTSKDILYSNHRGHGHYLAYCDDPAGLIAEIMGRPEGTCGGVGGSQHLQKNNFYSNGIQGAGLPVVAGMALAEKLKGSGAIAVAFMGDGTFGEGAVYEAFNIAALWGVPMLIVVEHNQYAQSTPSSDQHAGELERRAEPFGIPVTVVDGMNVQGVYESAREVVGEIRMSGRPQMLFLNTYRFAPHSKGDDFRDREEVEEHRKRDPLLLISEELGENLCSPIIASVKKRIDGVVMELAE